MEIYKVLVVRGSFKHEVIINNIATAKEVYDANKEIYGNLPNAFIQMWKMKFDNKGILIKDKML